MQEKLIITKKLRGDDGYRVFSVRLKVEILDRVDEISKATGRTRNELIGILLDFAIQHSEVSTEQQESRH